LRGLTALVTAAAMVMGGPEALADGEQAVVGLLEVSAVGVDPVVRDRFAEAIEEGLAGSADFVPATRARMREMLANSSWSAGCTFGPCLAEVRAQTGAAYVVTAGVSGSGQSYRMTISLIETGEGKLVGQVTETCPACTVEDVASSAMLSTIELINGVSAAGLPDGGGEGAGPPRRAGDHARTVRRTGLLFAAGTPTIRSRGNNTLSFNNPDVAGGTLSPMDGL